MSAEAVRLERVRAAMAGRSVSLALDLRVATGEWVVLIGPSGSGKSLILELAAGLVLPDEGRVSVLGREWSAPTDDHQTSLRLRIGAVLQPPGLLSNMTVFNNVALPLRYHRFALSDREREQIVATHLDHMALLPLRDRFPAELNPGEIRRAAIARAMVLDPDVLLLDDPVDGLDIDMVLRLRRYLEESRAVPGARGGGRRIEKFSRIALRNVSGVPGRGE